MNTLKKAVAVLAVVAAGYAPVAGADIKTFDLDFLFKVPAAGPLITATFEDVTTGTVTLTIVNVGLPASEYIKNIYFNTTTAITGFLWDGSSVKASGTTYTPNLFNPDGAGLYDIQLAYSSAPAKQFNGGETSIYTLTGSGLNVNSFNLKGATPYTYGPYFAVAQRDGGGNAQWISAPIPEPETYAMMLAGLGLMGWMARRRRQSLQPEPV